MGWLFKTLNSVLGKKLLMALTGLFLITFLCVHLFGNIFLYVGKEEFNKYVDTLEGGLVHAFILVMEVVLVTAFFFHILNGVRLTLQNMFARGTVKYAVYKPSEQVTLASRSMFVSASIVFIFLVIHLRNFWFEYKFGGLSDTTTPYDIVVSTFQIPLYSLLYVVGVGLLGFHLYHGFQSAFQTLGINHKKYTPIIVWVGRIYAIVVALAFASFPIYFLFFYGGK
jgi:succinate dehydrogenase / fumarate reductase, cytochrome b subunit